MTSSHAGTGPQRRTVSPPRHRRERTSARAVSTPALRRMALDDHRVVVVGALEGALDEAAVDEQGRRRVDARAARGPDVGGDALVRRGIVEALLEGVHV